VRALLIALSDFRFSTSAKTPVLSTEIRAECRQVITNRRYAHRDCNGVCHCKSLCIGPSNRSRALLPVFGRWVLLDTRRIEVIQTVINFHELSAINTFRFGLSVEAAKSCFTSLQSKRRVCGFSRYIGLAAMRREPGKYSPTNDFRNLTLCELWPNQLSASLQYLFRGCFKSSGPTHGVTGVRTASFIIHNLSPFQEQVLGPFLRVGGLRPEGVDL